MLRHEQPHLAEALRPEGVLIEPGRAFFAGAGPRNYYRLAYSSIAPQRIAEGVARIARALAPGAARR